MISFKTELWTARERTKAQTLLWLEANVSQFSQCDLRDPCDCGACFEESSKYFAYVLDVCGEEALKQAIYRGLNHKDVLPQALELVWWYFRWFKRRKAAGVFLALLPDRDPTASFLQNLDPAINRRLVETRTFANNIKFTKEVIRVIEGYFNFPDGIVEKYRVHAGSAMLYDLSREASTIKNEIENTTPVIDLTLPIRERYKLFKESGNFKFIRAYFDLKNEASFLRKKIEIDEDRFEIVGSIPIGKLSWKRFKKSLLSNSNSSQIG